MEDFEYWDKPEEEYDSDNNVAISPVTDVEIIFEGEQTSEETDMNKELKEKITVPVMWYYEKSNIIYKREKQLNSGSRSTMEDVISKNGLTSSYDIANLEFDNGKLPNYTIIRKLDRGYYEIWKHSDFLFFPK